MVAASAHFEGLTKQRQKKPSRNAMETHMITTYIIFPFTQVQMGYIIVVSVLRAIRTHARVKIRKHIMINHQWNEQVGYLYTVHLRPYMATHFVVSFKTLGFSE